MHTKLIQTKNCYQVSHHKIVLTKTKKKIIE